MMMRKMLIGRVGRARCVALATRCMSAQAKQHLVQVVSLERLAHQGRVALQIADAAKANVRIVPTLHPSEFALRVFRLSEEKGEGGEEEVFSVHEEGGGEDDAHAKTLRLTKTGTSSQDIEVLLSVPHLVDLDVQSVRGSVAIDDKIEGNVRVALSHGDIRVNKVRGEDIQLKTSRGRIDVAALVEGEKVKLTASAVAVKRLMSASTEVKLGKSDEDADLGAIYSALCLVNTQSTGTLKVGNIHGFLRVNGEAMKAVHVNSVNGALHIEDSGADCFVDAHFDAWSPDAANKIFVGGDVRVSLDPSAPIDVELHGSKIATDTCKFSESELDQLDEDYAIFTGSLLPTATSPDRASAASGKINVGSAKHAALRTSFFAAENDTSDQGTAASSSDIHPSRLPRLVVHASNGSVKLEQLDWMGKIKRKHLTQ